MFPDQQYEIQDLADKKKFFSQVPIIILKMGLDPYAIAYYVVLKCTAGVSSKKSITQKKLAQMTGCSDRHIRNLNKLLSQPFEILNGKPLIQIIARKDNAGRSLPNVIQLVDIWEENMEILAESEPFPDSESPKNRLKDLESSTEFTEKKKRIVKKEITSTRQEYQKSSRVKGLTKEEPDCSGKIFNSSSSLKKTKVVNVHNQAIEEHKSVENAECGSLMEHGSYITINIVSNKNDKKNDIVKKDRSLDKHPWTIDFDPKTYLLPNGHHLSLRMQRSLAKYDPDNQKKIAPNIRYFENQVKKGILIANLEAYLQSCITNNYAAKESNKAKNQTQAQAVKQQHKLSNLSIMKTVMQLTYQGKTESIPFSLPNQTFSSVLDGYVRKVENSPDIPIKNKYFENNSLKPQNQFTCAPNDEKINRDYAKKWDGKIYRNYRIDALSRGVEIVQTGAQGVIPIFISYQESGFLDKVKSRVFG